MKNLNNRYWKFLLLIVAAVFAGCASSTYNAKFFHGGAPKRLAIISIEGTTSGFGLSVKEEEEFITGVATVVSKELHASDSYKLISQDTVFKSASYKAIPGEEKDGIFSFRVPKGFKKLSSDNEKKLAANIIKELKLDGVIAITASSAKVTSGFSIGFISIGSGNARSNVVIRTYDKNGEVVWGDVAQMDNDKGVTEVMGIGNNSQILVNILDSVQSATRQIVANLKKNIA